MKFKEQRATTEPRKQGRNKKKVKQPTGDARYADPNKKTAYWIYVYAKVDYHTVGAEGMPSKIIGHSEYWDPIGKQWKLIAEATLTPDPLAPPKGTQICVDFKSLNNNHWHMAWPSPSWQILAPPETSTW